jgi:hypothetical protein
MYLSILLASIAGMVVGFLWYGPLFGKLWRNLKGMSEEEMRANKEKGMTWIFVQNFLAYVVMAYIFYDVVGVMFLPFTQALWATFWLWLGFVATVVFVNNLYSGKPSYGLFLVDSLHYLFTMEAMTMVLVYWG